MERSWSTSYSGQARLLALLFAAALSHALVKCQLLAIKMGLPVVTDYPWFVRLEQLTCSGTVLLVRPGEESLIGGAFKAASVRSMGGERNAADGFGAEMRFKRARSCQTCSGSALQGVAAGNVDSKDGAPHSSHNKMTRVGEFRTVAGSRSGWPRPRI